MSYIPRIVVVGAGGHGREVACVVASSGASLGGFVDDGVPDHELLVRFGSAHLGGIGALAGLKGIRVVLGVGSGSVRRLLDAEVSESLFCDPIIDPMASIGIDVRLQKGVVVFAQSTVTTNVDIGKHTHIGRGAAIGHDCRIDAYVTVMPMASISGNVSIGKSATIGTGAVVRQGQSIGDGAYVGAGAVVVNDVPPGAVVVGNPARALNPH